MSFTSAGLLEIEDGRIEVETTYRGLPIRIWQRWLPKLTQPRAQEYLLHGARNYRDALAHRIPLYVPPSAMTPADEKRTQDIETAIRECMRVDDFDGVDKLQGELSTIGHLLPVFSHSFGDHDSPGPVYFHPQLIADSRTLFEVIARMSPVPLTQLD